MTSQHACLSRWVQGSGWGGGGEWEGGMFAFTATNQINWQTCNFNYLIKIAMEGLPLQIS